MKLTVIGHWAGYPKANDATSGYLLQHDGFNVLIDCGSGVLSNMLHFVSNTELHAVVISHYHHDHIADVGPLQYASLVERQLGKVNSPLKVYGPSNLHLLTLFHMTRKAEKTIGPFELEFHENVHSIKSFAIKATCGSKSVAYLGDTAYHETLAEFVSDVDLFICEASFYPWQDAVPYGHLTSTEAARIAQKASVNHLLLTHLPHFGNVNELLEDAKKHFEQRTSLAFKGWCCEI
ncbi:hypothetical protein P9112_013234 [Eukaryota sp. TZLM1-RC]